MKDLLKGINVFLIGMMGSGKSTVGQLLAQQLGYRFFDTDVLIQRVVGKTINEIFASEGEDNFRTLETQVLSELSACTRSAIATGGGIVLRTKNWSYLHHGLVIWLDAPVELLVKRLAEDSSRPLLKDTDLQLKLSDLQKKRNPLYTQADLRIIIEDKQTPAEIVLEILAAIPTVLKPRNTAAKWEVN